MSYKATIGLEVHAELKTTSKMFCGCENNPHHAEPNTHTCPVCLAHPGTLPVPNKKAIEMVLLFGRAVDATPATYSEFDRKNYFYPDIPKAYQISQYKFPFLTGGSLCEVALTRVHLEEDTARSIHDKGEDSLVDFNRAGVPLMELVTEPVIHDAKTAGNFARELQLMLRTLHISDANMERGEMRVEANISVSKTDELGTKVEVKNLNSFKSVEAAIEYEIARHIAALESGEVLQQETRGWDEVKLRTFSQRSKETAKDYRYFPDPDIPKIDVFRVRLGEIMPKLPAQLRNDYRELGIKDEQIEIIISDRNRVDFFEATLSATPKPDPILAANYLTSDVLGVVEGSGRTISEYSADYFAELIVMLTEKRINSRTAKDLIPELFIGGTSPEEMVRERGLGQVSDVTELRTILEKVITENESVATEFKEGKDAAMNFLVGQGMKATRGAADPALLKEIITGILR